MNAAHDHQDIEGYAYATTRDLLRYMPARNNKAETAAAFQEAASQAEVYLDLSTLQVWNLLCDALTLRYGAAWHAAAAQGAKFPLMSFQAKRCCRYLARPFGELVAQMEHRPLSPATPTM